MPLVLIIVVLWKPFSMDATTNVVYRSLFSYSEIHLLLCLEHSNLNPAVRRAESTESRNETLRETQTWSSKPTHGQFCHSSSCHCSLLGGALKCLFLVSPFVIATFYLILSYFSCKNPRFPEHDEKMSGTPLSCIEVPKQIQKKFQDLVSRCPALLIFAISIFFIPIIYPH